jgi:hypothetical protein
MNRIAVITWVSTYATPLLDVLSSVASAVVADRHPVGVA